MLPGQSAYFIEVDPPCLSADPVMEELVVPAGEVGLEAVSQMTSVGQAHGQDGVPRFKRCAVHGLVRRRAGMGLHIRMLGAVQLLGPLYRQRLYSVDDLAAPVVASPGIALRVLVSENASHGLEN